MIKARAHKGHMRIFCEEFISAVRGMCDRREVKHFMRSQCPAKEWWTEGTMQNQIRQ
jgi:hypothetical protein